MERHFQYYVPFTNDTHYRARVRKHNNIMVQILNYTCMHEHAHLIHVHVD